jgi:type II secretory pathway pseudopilin PulG
MIVVAIVGTLSAVAIPSLMRYSRRARTSEALQKLAYIHRMSATYVSGESNVRTVTLGETHSGHIETFPESTSLTPTTVPSGIAVLTTTEWMQPGWQALAFSIADPHRYAYEYVSSGSGTNAMFTARALGDLDGDGVYSTFERAGALSARGEVTGSVGIFMVHETE